MSDTNILWLPSFSKWQHSDVSHHVPCTCSWVNLSAESGTGESWCRHLCCSCSPFNGTHFWTSIQCSYSSYIQHTHVSISVAASKCLEAKMLDLLFYFIDNIPKLRVHLQDPYIYPMILISSAFKNGFYLFLIILLKYFSTSQICS